MSETPPPGGRHPEPKIAAPRPAPRSEVERLLEATPGVSSAPAPEPLVEELVRGPIPGPVRVLFLDVDGTLTDGVIGTDATGDFRHFWVRDGLALQWARDLGVTPVVISGRASPAVTTRMTDLSLECHQGIQDKVAVAAKVLERLDATWEQSVMVGDDLPDVALMKRVGWPIAVGDAQLECRAVAKTITGARGGFGAVREVVEMVLRHNGTWEQVLQRYGAR